jgi:hypothetical protein
MNLTNVRPSQQHAGAHPEQPVTERCGPLSALESARLSQLESRIEVGLESFLDVAEALLEVQDKELWRGKYKDFEDYCRGRWDITPRRARQITAGAGVVRSLREGNKSSDAPLPLPTREGPTRVLQPLPETERREVYREAVASADGKVPTGRQIEEVVRKRKPEFEISDLKFESRGMPAGGWPKVDSHKCFPDKACKRIIFNNASKVKAEICYLQFGERSWVSNSLYQYYGGSMAGQAGPLGLRPLTPIFPTMAEAIMAAAATAIDEHKQIAKGGNGCTSAEQRAAARHVVAWAEALHHAAEQATRDACVKPKRPHRLGMFDETPAKPSVLTSAPASKEEEIRTEADGIMNSLYDFRGLYGSRPGSQHVSEAIHEWQSLVSGIDQSERMQGTRTGAKRVGDKGSENGGLFVICREPLKGAICKTAQVARFLGYEGWWTLDPLKVTPFTDRSDAEAKAARNGDTVMSLARAKLLSSRKQPL